MFDTSDEYYMMEALKEAQKGFDADEIPVGAVVVCQDRIIARAYNNTEKLRDVTAHAEMLAFTSAMATTGGKYLQNCTLYVTLEPCVMCAGAASWTQIGRIVYGASDEKKGFSKIDYPILHPKTKVTKGVLATECESILKEFFSLKRKY
jgi:tRNA(adenine34) deaminase